MSDLQRLKFQVVSSWLWLILFPALLALVVVFVLHIDLSLAREWWGSRPYFQAYLEFIVGGLLPVIFTWRNKERLASYGFTRIGFWRGLGFSLLIALARAGLSYATTGEWIAFAPFDADLSAGGRIWFALIGIFSNGPLEVFFFIWLVTNTERIMRDARLFSKGFLLTLVLFGFAHILTTQSLVNALYILGIFLLLGLVYKSTGNFWGPALGWTLMNGMVWSYVTLIGM